MGQTICSATLVLKTIRSILLVILNNVSTADFFGYTMKCSFYGIYDANKPFNGDGGYVVTV